MRPRGSKVRLMNHTVTKVYYTLNEITACTGFSRHKIITILEQNKIPFHQNGKGKNIRIHIDEVNTYFKHKTIMTKDNILSGKFTFQEWYVLQAIQKTTSISSEEIAKIYIAVRSYDLVILIINQMQLLGESFESIFAIMAEQQKLTEAPLINKIDD